MVWLNTLRLKSNSPEVRRKALETLDPAGNARALELLLAGLSDEDAQVRCAAVKGLERARDDQSMAALIDALQDPTSTVREVAAASAGTDRRFARLSAPDLVVEGLRIPASGQPPPLRCETWAGSLPAVKSRPRSMSPWVILALPHSPARRP